MATLLESARHAIAKSWQPPERRLKGITNRLSLPPIPGNYDRVIDRPSRELEAAGVHSFDWAETCPECGSHNYLRRADNVCAACVVRGVTPAESDEPEEPTELAPPGYGPQLADSASSPEPQLAENASSPGPQVISVITSPAVDSLPARHCMEPVLPPMPERKPEPESEAGSITVELSKVAPDKSARLTAKEWQMCCMLAQGMSTKQIAAAVGISAAGASERRNRFARKYGINPSLLLVWAWLRVQAEQGEV